MKYRLVSTRIFPFIESDQLEHVLPGSWGWIRSEGDLLKGTFIGLGSGAGDAGACSSFGTC